MATSFSFVDTRANSGSTKDLPHDDYGTQFNVINWFLTGIAFFALGLRLYVKRRLRKQLWWDDYVLVAAMIALIVQTSLNSVMVHFGFGKHSWDIRDFYHYNLYAYPTGVWSITAAAWSKTGFAITLLRLTKGWWRRFVWFVIISVNVILGLSAMFSYIQCWPVTKLWVSKTPGTCWPGYVMVYYNSFAACWSGAMDIALALMPWWILNRCSMKKKEKLGLLVCMSMGVFAGITSIGKTATLWGIKSSDTINSVPVMILATAEIAITILAASIPILRLLVKELNSRQGKSATGLSNSYGSRGSKHLRLNSGQGQSRHQLVDWPSPVVAKRSQEHDDMV